MTLTLKVLRCPDRVPPQTRNLEGGEFSIGRGAENDWVLPDPDRILSKKHCVLAYRSGYWQVLDTSSNGTFVNHDPDPIGSGGARDLRDGDRLRFGPYEIEIGIIERRPERPSPPPERFATPPRYDPPAFDPPPRSLNPFESTGAGLQKPLLPDNFNPLHDEEDLPAYRGPTQPDHAPAIDDAFRPPPPMPSQPISKPIPDDEDWNFDLGLQPVPPPEKPVAAIAVPPEPRPAEIPSSPEARPIEAAVPPHGVPSPPVNRPISVPASAATSDSELLAAFLDGACIEHGTPADPEATMRAVGRTFRALVSGLRQAIMARAEIKGEFRIERTMIRARGNNPLKFSADDDDALSALLGIGRVTDMDPARAVTEVLRDMRLHEVASVKAMETGVRGLVSRFAPGPLRAKADEAGGIALVPAQRKARAWELFEKLHQETSRALDDDFDSLFGRAFARAYEQVLRELGGEDDG